MKNPAFIVSILFTCCVFFGSSAELNSQGARPLGMQERVRQLTERNAELLRAQNTTLSELDASIEAARQLWIFARRR